MPSYKIVPDSDLQDPCEWDKGFTLAIFSRSRRFGDQDHGLELKATYGEMQKYLERRSALVVPVTVYEHSNILFHTGAPTCRFDSARAGFAYVPKGELRKNFGTVAKAKVAIENFLQAYNAYLNGDGYGFQILDDAGNVIDSCYGFYSESDAREGAEESLKCHMPAAA